MNSQQKPSRRKALQTGLASVAAAAAVPSLAHSAIRPKAPGETKIVAIMGYDAMHNGVAYETSIRGIFSSKEDWRLIFCRTSKVFNPELLRDADLLMTQLFGGPYEANPDGISDTWEARKPIWTDENVKAVVENVTKRGMGWMPVHNAIWFGIPELEDLMGTRAILHQEIQPVIYDNFNQDHPITKGIEPFFTNLDEQFNVELQSPSTTTVLFRSFGVHDKNPGIGGWCHERGKGRVVGLLPGHEHWVYRVKEYQEIFWRAVHWAMGRDIPPYPNAGTGY